MEIACEALGYNPNETHSDPNFDQEDKNCEATLSAADDLINPDNDTVCSRIYGLICSMASKVMSLVFFSSKRNGQSKQGKRTYQENIPTSVKIAKFPFYHNEMNDIQTLGDSISYFGLSSRLEDLEKSLEDVRRKKKSVKEHEEFFKKIYKETLKLSYRNHPDRIQNEGGSEEDVARAQCLQTALNATRSGLAFVNSVFIEDIETDHKFGFYTKLSISTLCNEDEMRSHIYKVILKISMISRIKNQNIILEIRNFLIDSNNCIDSYLRDRKNFEKYRDLALLHLIYCIEGFKKMSAEFEEVKEQCKSENNENVYQIIYNMESECKRDLRVLESLRSTAKAALKSNYTFFSPTEVMDPYFVLPLVSYTNVILMCNVMTRKSSVFDILNTHVRTSTKCTEDLSYLMDPYYLTSYLNGNNYYYSTVLDIMYKEGNIPEDCQLQQCRGEIKDKLDKCIIEVKGKMESKFKVEDYYETPMTNLFALDLQKCLNLMKEFQKEEEEISKVIDEIQEKAEKMNEMYEKFDKMIEVAEERNREANNLLQRSKQMNEKITNSVI